jgi:hypothetical protein
VPPGAAAPSAASSPYYLANFTTLLEEVERRYADLLAPAETDFVAAFRRLGEDARRLYVRLAARRAPCFRIDRLHYDEIDLGAARRELLAAGFAEHAGAERTGERLASLNRQELLAWGGELDPRLGAVLRRSSKAEVVARLAAAAPERAAELAARYPLLGLLRLDVLRVLRLLFFGNLSQDWTHYLLRDLGVLRFEPYALAPGARCFADRRELEWSLLLYDRRAAVDAHLAGGEVDAAAALAHDLVARAAALGGAPRRRRRLDDLLLAVARARERRGQLDEALELYAAAHEPPARERRARVLLRQGRAAAAAELYREMGAAPRDERERRLAERFAARPLAGVRRRGLSPRRTRSPAGERVLHLRRSPAVEQAALAALAAEGWRGFFAENWLWRTLFGLAFWDVVFAPVPGAFAHPFQHGPLDLEEGFRAARAERIAARLAALRSDPRPGPALLETWDRKFGTANRLVSFAPGLRAHLQAALEVLDGAQIAAVSDRLSHDLRRYGRGLPDLFLVRGATPGELLLAEVKAPGDQLSAEQRGWLAYLPRHHLPTAVLRLRWREGA